jgi:hypothetical protein
MFSEICVICGKFFSRSLCTMLLLFFTPCEDFVV